MCEPAARKLALSELCIGHIMGRSCCLVWKSRSSKGRHILTFWQARRSVSSTYDILLVIILIKSVNHHASCVLVRLCEQGRLWPSMPGLLHISERTLQNISSLLQSFEQPSQGVSYSINLVQPPESRHAASTQHKPASARAQDGGASNHATNERQHGEVIGHQ